MKTIDLSHLKWIENSSWSYDKIIVFDITIYKQKKDEVTALGKKWYKLIEKTVKKLHQELGGMQKKYEALLKKQETNFKEIIENLDEINRKATLQNNLKNHMMSKNCRRLCH